jgi:diguanylate cyclase (GGDEF)-like protein
MPRKTLRAVSHETINELFQKYEFATPGLYESVFNEKAAQRGINIQELKPIEELKKLMLEIDVKIQNHVDGFTKLSAYTQEAKVAIETKNIAALDEIREKTTEMLYHLKGIEEEFYHDSLTGLLNQKGLMRYTVTPSKNMGMNGILLVFDLDNFKKINRTYGHNIGNAVIKKFASVLQKGIENIPEKSKFLARFDSDEFIMIVDEHNMNYVKNQFRKLQKKGLLLKIKEQEEKVNFSFGAAVFANGKKYADILNKADEEMYRNKLERKEA